MFFQLRKDARIESVCFAQLMCQHFCPWSNVWRLPRHLPSLTTGTQSCFPPLYSMPLNDSHCNARKPVDPGAQGCKIQHNLDQKTKLHGKVGNQCIAVFLQENCFRDRTPYAKSKHLHYDSHKSVTMHISTKPEWRHLHCNSDQNNLRNFYYCFQLVAVTLCNVVTKYSNALCYSKDPGWGSTRQ